MLHAVTFLAICFVHGALASKSGFRITLNDKSISSVDATHDGFRVILTDAFIKAHLQPALQPVLYLTAIPLETAAPREPVVAVTYADSPLTGKQLHVSGLRAHSWHYVCVEFENFYRQNETSGVDCEVHRTLDFAGKTATSTVVTPELVDATSQSLAFTAVTEGSFERRLVFTLRNGKTAIPAAQVFYLDKPAELDVKFASLRPDKLYGQLCVLEEPLVDAHTAMGRRIAGVRRESCYFGNLKTRDYDWSIFEAEASPYSSSPGRLSPGVPLLAAALAFWLLL